MSEISPAMTPKGWLKHLADNWGDYNFAKVDATHLKLDGDWRRHEMAARCLHGQPFGFTRDDVTMLRRIEDEVPEMAGWSELVGLADRIEALLPPEDEA